MKDKYKHRPWLIVTLITLFFVIPTVANAEGLGYSVRAIIPENQINKDLTYFDLLVKPGAKQTLELEITSSSKEPINLEIEPNIATTNQNGELEYSVVPEKNDETLIYPITDLLSGKQSITLAPKETKVISFNLKVPKEAFEGKLVGAFNISEAEEDQIKKNEQKSDVQISNIMSLGIGIQLRESEEPVKPDLRMNQVRANLFNYRTAVTANLQNPRAEFLGHLKVNAKIRKAGSDTVLYEMEKEEMSMAPNSNFDFAIPLNNQEIEKGEYEIELLASSGEETWPFNQTFTVTREEAKELNQEAVELEQSKINWLLIIQIIVIVIILLVIILMLIKIYQDRKRTHHSRKR